MGADLEDQAATELRTTPAAGVPETVFHFSEDGSIEWFVPHVPQTNPSQPPAVWAIDAEHSPLYWFPRHCPRISVWAYDDEQRALLRSTFRTDASRICAAEIGWLGRIRSTRLYRYAFDGSDFERWAEAYGHYVSDHTVVPRRVDELGDLLALHAAADVELRFTPKLDTLMDDVLAGGLPFSFVRIRNARR